MHTWFSQRIAKSFNHFQCAAQSILTSNQLLYMQFTCALTVSPYANVLRLCSNIEQVSWLVSGLYVVLGDKPNAYAFKSDDIKQPSNYAMEQKKTTDTHSERNREYGINTAKKNNKTREYFVCTSRWFSRFTIMKIKKQTALRLFSVGRSYLCLLFFCIFIVK